MTKVILFNDEPQRPYFCASLPLSIKPAEVIIHNNPMLSEVEIGTDLRCFHCGHACEDALWQDDKSFCCYGCKKVYEILSANQLCQYYDLDQNPGLQLKTPGDETFQFLDEKEIAKKILEFDSVNFSRVRFSIPAIHCISCIWFLENLRSIQPLVAAILMPVSSISVVGFSTLAVNFTTQRQLNTIKHEAYELHNR